MMNYKSATEILRSAGYVLTNTCHMDGNTYHDFNSRKRDAAISLIIDESTGAVAWGEITTRKWENGHYIPINTRFNRLQELIDSLNR